MDGPLPPVYHKSSCDLGLFFLFLDQTDPGIDHTISPGISDLPHSPHCHPPVTAQNPGHVTMLNTVYSEAHTLKQNKSISFFFFLVHCHILVNGIIKMITLIKFDDGKPLKTFDYQSWLAGCKLLFLRLMSFCRPLNCGCM